MIIGVGKAMKRPVIKISLAIFVVVGILLGLLAVLTRDWGPEMPFVDHFSSFTRFCILLNISGILFLVRASAIHPVPKGILPGSVYTR